MESIFPRGSVPTMQDRFLTINGTCNFHETKTRNVRVGTKLRTIYGVYFQGYQFEEFTQMPQLSYSIGTAADGTKYFDFQVPASYVVSYFIVGSEAIEAQEFNTEFSIIDDDVTLDLSKFHNHDGINSPKIGISNLSGGQANSIPAYDSNGNLIWLSTLSELPGDFSLTAPINDFNFDATSGGTRAFTWGSSSGATSYNIQIIDLTSDTVNYSGTGVSSGMTRNKSTFTNGHSYSWNVTAVNAAGTKTIFNNGTFNCSLPS